MHSPPDLSLNIARSLFFMLFNSWTTATEMHDPLAKATTARHAQNSAVAIMLDSTGKHEPRGLWLAKTKVAKLGQ